MSLWDGIIVLTLAIGIFQGYRRGFLLRITGWVGGVLAFFLARPLAYALDAPVSKIMNGEAVIAEWLNKKFITEYTVSDFLNGKNLFQWVDKFEDLKDYRSNILENFEKLGTNLFTDMSNALSHAIAQPIWHMALTFFSWVLIMLAFVFLGRLCAYFLDKFPTLGVVDSFLGAFVSLIVVFIVLIGVNTVAINFVNEATAVGQMVHHSYFAPFFKNIFDLFIK